MYIKYQNEKLKNNYQDKDIFTKMFSLPIWKQYVKFEEKIIGQKNMGLYRILYKGDNIESLQGRPTWSARLNKQYRVEFTVNSKVISDITEITIVKVHSHKYNK